MQQEPIIEIEGLGTYIGGQWVHKDLDLTIYRGEIFGIVGGSGTGKTTLIREVLMLRKPDAGRIRVFGIDIKAAPVDLPQRWGMMFQQGALFSSLTVLENVAFPLKKFTKLKYKTIEHIAMLKIALVGLPPSAAAKFPSELSGGMLKRAAVARALAMDPELLFLDEPTAGLDPHGANALDALILELQKSLGLTIVLVSHDLDTLWHITDRVAFIGEGQVLACGPMEKLAQCEQPLVKEYFSGPRARIAQGMEPTTEQIK